MNGVHDVGGMDGFGPIQPEANEPVFHATWEARVFALLWLAPAGWQDSRDARNGRFDLESLPPADYLAMSYYERWLQMGIKRLLRAGLVTTAELETGRADSARPAPAPRTPLDEPETGNREPDSAPRFAVDDRVRARNLHPRGHTRLPRYVRGKRGFIVRNNGPFALQDTDEEGWALSPRPQSVYTVRFEGEELWGDRAGPRDSVYLDLWEDYLEAA